MLALDMLDVGGHASPRFTRPPFGQAMRPGGVAEGAKIFGDASG